MKINKVHKPLIERYIYKNIEVDSPYGYEVEEVAIKDSAIKTYIDLKYSAKDIIDLARMIYGSGLKNNDIDFAYDILIDYYYDSSTEEDPKFDTPELEEFYNYIDKKVIEDYSDEAQDQFNQAEADAEEIRDFEDSHRYGEL